MFEMDKDKNRKAPKTVFDLEESLKANPQRKKEILDSATEQMQLLRTMLRKGESDQKKYEQLAFLLHGYSSLIKVVSRIK